VAFQAGDGVDGNPSGHDRTLLCNSDAAMLNR